MKKKLKLEKWGKVLISAIVIAIGIGIYSRLKTLGSEVGTNQIASILCITGWTYLVFVQTIVLAGVWEN